MADEFKRLDRELVYKGSIVDFYKDTVKVPNGNVVKWDFIKHQGAAAVVPVMEDGRILMVRQYRNALDRYTLEIPAGGLNGPEEPTMEAAARELEEETGYHAGEIKWLITIRTTVAFCNEKIDIYVATDLTPGSIQSGQNIIYNILLMHHPAKYDIFIGRTLYKIIQKKSYVLQYHLLCFLRHLKWVHVPTPVTVQKDAVIQFLFQNLAGGCLSHAHRSTNHI